MALAKSLVDDDFTTTYDSIDDEVEFAIFVNGDFEDMNTHVDDIDEILDSPLTEALELIDSLYEAGDGSVDFNILDDDSFPELKDNTSIPDLERDMNDMITADITAGFGIDEDDEIIAAAMSAAD